MRRAAMNRFGLVLPLFTILALTCAAEDAPPADPRTEVTVEGGRMAGVMLADSVRVYKGVPYAAPPVDALRWKPPQPVVPWDGVRACTRFGPVCWQAINEKNQTDEPMSEDCLFLNIWTSARTADEKLPVLVWIHGGGLARGSGSKALYDGYALARRGAVVVTLNYRLGPFGFFAHPRLSAESPQGVSGNYGLLDQMAALKWIHRNIGKLGGDPDRVLIFGCSAGGGSVGMHMISPLSKGLFSRAVLQSGLPNGKAHLKKPWYGLKPLEETGVEWSGKWGCEAQADPLSALRALPPDRLLEAVEGTFPAVVDGWVLPDDPMELWEQGRSHAVPFMAGSTKDEGTSRVPADVKTVAAYVAWVRTTYGEDADVLLTEFPAPDDAAVPAALHRLANCASLTGPVRRMVDLRMKAEGKAWLYHVTRVPDTEKARASGAYHCIEVEYVFGTLPPGACENPEDRGMADRIQQFFLNFATHGDPNGAGLPPWPAWSSGKPVQMLFDAPMSAVELPSTAGMTAFAKIAAEKRATRFGNADR